MFNVQSKTDRKSVCVGVMLRCRRSTALFLPDVVCVDVPRRSPALRHARRSVRGREISRVLVLFGRVRCAIDTFLDTFIMPRPVGKWAL